MKEFKITSGISLTEALREIEAKINEIQWMLKHTHAIKDTDGTLMCCTCGDKKT